MPDEIIVEDPPTEPPGQNNPEKMAKECMKEATKILASYNYMVTNIPIASEYWMYMNGYRMYMDQATHGNY